MVSMRLHVHSPTDSSGQHQHHNKRNPTFCLALCSNAIIWRFLSVTFFFLVVCSLFFSVIFPKQSAQKKVCPTSSHRKTEIPHNFRRERDSERKNLLTHNISLDRKNKNTEWWEFRSGFKIESTALWKKNVGVKINNGCNELIKGLQRFNLLECSF